MYFFFGIFLILCIFFFCLCYWKKNCIIEKIRCMDFCQKVCTLNQLLCPFGFSYLPEQDIVTSTQDAWQREFGYCALFDRAAVHFNMVFDCEPIYFNYQGRTWLIEFWKGQYGINTGGEIGIYHTDSVIAPEQYDKTLFHSVSDQEMPYMTMQLFFKGRLLFSLHGVHWWLTGFDVGHFCEPEDLTMKASVTFPNACMLQSFVDGLMHSGYNECALFICDLTVCFTFAVPCTRQHRPWLAAHISQFENRLFCKLFRFITRPFTCTLDKLLYLYYFLPAAFRHMFCFRKCRKQKMPRCRRKRRHCR